MANKGNNYPRGNKSPETNIPTEKITKIDDLLRFDSRRWEEIRYKSGDYQFYGTGMIVGVDVQTFASVGINQHLEVPKDDKAVPGQGSFVKYASETQLLLRMSFDRDGHIKVDGWELSEPSYLKTGSKEDSIVIGTTKIVGEQINSPTIVVNPLESAQEYGVSKHYEAAKNGFYGDGYKFKEFSPELLGDISCKKYTNGGFMRNVTPVDVALLMQRESDFIILMRDNEMGFVHSDQGKTISNSYLQRQLEIYERIYTEKFPLDAISVDDRNMDVIQQRRAHFEEIVKSPEFIAAERESKSQFYREYAEYQVSALSKALDERRFTSPEQIMRAEEQLKYYSSYSRFAELSSEWNTRIIGLNDEAVKAGIISEDERKHMLAYLSNQNGYSKSNFESLCAAFDNISSRMSQENAVTNGGSKSALTEERFDYYSSQLVYLEQLIRTHPENPMNKPTIPITSSVDANIQKVDASFEDRVNKFNDSSVVQENPNKALSINVLANRDRCEAFLKTYGKEPEMAEAISIVQDAIRSNRYEISQSTYDSFVERKNEALILKLIAESKGENPVFTYDELLEVHKQNSPEALKSFLISKANLDYSYTNMDDFWRSPKLLAAINNPERIADPISTSPLFKYSIEDLNDPIKCQTMKKELILAFDEAQKGHMAVDALIRDMELIDSHIIENRMRLNENQRSINHYDFDNVYSIHISNETSKEIEQIFGVKNIEKFKDPLYIQELIEKESTLIRIKEEKAFVVDDKVPSKGSTEIEAQQREDAVQAAIENNYKVQFLKMLLNQRESDLGYDVSTGGDNPQAVKGGVKIPESIRLENELMNWGIQHKAQISKLDSVDARITFIKENFENANEELLNKILSKPNVYSAVENGFENMQSKPTSISECISRFETYNDIIRKYNDGQLDKKDFKNDDFAKELLEDKAFIKALKEGKLEEIKLPFGNNEFNASNPLHCYILSQQLENSKNPYAQRIGADLHTIMDSMEPELKSRIIFKNCEELVHRNLSIDEMAMLRGAAQRELASCYLQEVQLGILSQDKLNQSIESDVQSVRTRATLGLTPKDTSKLGEIFDVSNLANDRKAIIEAKSSEMIDSAKKYEECLKTFHELTRKSFAENEEINGKKGSSLSTAEQFSKIQTIQTFQNADSFHKSLEELNSLLLNNKFYLEKASEIDKKMHEISGLYAKIDEELRPRNKQDYDKLKEFVAQIETDASGGLSQKRGFGKFFRNFSQESIEERHLSDLRGREERIQQALTKIEVLQREIEEIRDTNKLLASLESQRLNLESSINAYSVDGKVLEQMSQKDYLNNKVNYLLANSDIKDERFMIAAVVAESRGLISSDDWNKIYEAYEASIKDGDKKLSKEEFASMAESFVKESNREYVEFTKVGALEDKIKELDVVKSELTSLKEYIAITGAISAAQEYYKLGHELPTEDFLKVSQQLGIIESPSNSEIPRVSINKPIIEAIPFRAEDEGIKESINYIYNKDNLIFIEKVEDFLKSHSIDELNPQARLQLNTYLHHHEIVNQHLENMEGNIGPGLHPGQEKDGIIKFSEGNIVSIALGELNLPPIINSYYEENFAKPINSLDGNGINNGGKGVDVEDTVEGAVEKANAEDAENDAAAKAAAVKAAEAAAAAEM